jgi:hypothetical protein
VSSVAPVDVDVDVSLVLLDGVGEGLELVPEFVDSDDTAESVVLEDVLPAVALTSTGLETRHPHMGRKSRKPFARRTSEGANSHIFVSFRRR